MSSIRAALVAAGCLLLATACEKHQEPIGTVPADDIPAVPAPEPGTGAGREGVDCDRTTGAERETCLRNNPPATVTPAEPQQNPPPGE